MRQEDRVTVRAQTLGTNHQLLQPEIVVTEEAEHRWRSAGILWSAISIFHQQESVRDTYGLNLEF